MLGPKFIRQLGGVVPQGPNANLGQQQVHNDIYTYTHRYIQYTQCYNVEGVGVKRKQAEKLEAKTELF